MASADFGNYHNRRYEGMINIPIVDDRLDVRVAGEWTKRDGYSFNSLTNSPIDGRDLWSGRVTIGWKPTENVQAYLVWEHFQESDDRLRSSKQLYKTDYGPGGTPTSGTVDIAGSIKPFGPGSFGGDYFSQGCLPASFYSSDSYQAPLGFTLPYILGLQDEGNGNLINPYASETQSRNLRVIESGLNPSYSAKNDVLELNADYAVTPALTFTSQTGYNQDFLWSTEDYNRFNTSEGAFQYTTPYPEDGFRQWDANSLGVVSPDPNGLGHCRWQGSGDACAGLKVGDACTPLPGAANDTDGVRLGRVYTCVPDGVFCDPQLGCSDRLVAEDLSDERAWQLSQEFRFASHFTGPLNFSAGGNYLHYETVENYYVFINTLTVTSYNFTRGATAPPRPQTQPWVPGVSDNSNCLKGGYTISNPFTPYNIDDPLEGGCIYIDPNPLTSLNNQGHNYFLSQNPYVLNSCAAFGEVYYDISNDLKFTGGLRWTDDQKHFILVPSELLVKGYGYPVSGIVDQQWNQLTGRAALNWSPKLDFTDQTLVYGSYAHGYKAGGANPPGAILLKFADHDITSPIHPLTFKPEFIDAFELGSKNTLLDGGLTLNGDVFFYNYKSYQISEIVDRTSINLNFDATVKGAELETTWEPAPGLKFNFAGGYEDTRIGNGQSAIDLMDRTAGNTNWMVVKPFATQASNCILPTYVVAALIEAYYVDHYDGGTSLGTSGACLNAYSGNVDPLTGLKYTPYPTDTAFGTLPDSIRGTYKGFDPSTAPNVGEGIAKNLGGNELPNAPHFTTALSAEYTLPVSTDWAATLHSDFYWQSQSFARVFNDRPYDKIRGYSNVNLALILTSADGWQVLGYLKNVFDTTAITGDFLNSDDSGLTTNVFLTDPRLYGVRVTKNF
ncbi:MAG TPA: TonB-dependent receptor [Rhizomicrobium sp.]|nr:TonB-dependent receptor [Rhizomicrobium sp.]